MRLGTVRYIQCNIATWLGDLKDNHEVTSTYIKNYLDVMADHLNCVMNLFENVVDLPWAKYVPHDFVVESGLGDSRGNEDKTR